MLKLRKSDIGKAIALVVAITAVGAFGVWNITRSLHPGGRSAPRTQVTPQAGTTAAPAGTPTATGAELFAPQQQGAMANLLAQARFAPDPFRPAISFNTHAVAETRPQPAAPPKETAPTRVRPLPPMPGEETPSPTLEAVGIVSGDSPLAVLGDGKQHYYVRTGDKIVDGWRVTAIHATSVTVSKGKTQVTLPLVPPEP